MGKKPVLIEFSKNHKFFKSMLISVGKEIKHRATWMKLALSIGAAGMSLFDVGSDIYTFIHYTSIGEEETANLMLTFVILSLVFQMMLVVGVHHKNKKETISEIVKTITFTKPAFNKWRVLTNAEIEGHEVVTPVTEMMMFKLIEVFAESIPVTVLQVNKILTMTSENVTFEVLLALLISLTFVAEGITYLTFMKDINEDSRRTGKLFYGLIPLSGIRLWLVKGSMYLLSFCQLAGKSIMIALLSQIGGRTLAILVLSCEVVVYLLYKLARKDFRYVVSSGRSLSVALVANSLH